MMVGVLGRRPELVASEISERRPAASWHGSSDAELIAGVIARDDAATARLYDRFAGLINHVILRVLGGDADHDDLVHDVFLKLWHAVAAGRVQNPDSLQAYAASIATNVVYKELRKRYVRRRFFGREERAPEMTSRVEDHEAREVLTLVYAIASEFGPQDRLLFTLRHLGQYKLAEVAKLADCSLATVKRRLAKAEAQFVLRAQDYPEYPRLAALIEEGGAP